MYLFILSETKGSYLYYYHIKIVRFSLKKHIHAALNGKIKENRRND